MNVLQLGEIPYEKAYRKQLELVELVQSDPDKETLIVCSHPPVVTLGKKSTPADLMGWEGETCQIERGGKATYHGPQQVVVYPILDLKKRGQNLSGFLEALEKSMVDTCQEYDLKASGNPHRGKPDYTGVWLFDCNPPLKIASVGIAVKRWVTFHGLAFNLYEDPQAFQGISPCGLTTNTMTNLERELGRRVERSDFETKLIHHLKRSFSNLLT